MSSEEKRRIRKEDPLLPVLVAALYMLNMRKSNLDTGLRMGATSSSYKTHRPCCDSSTIRGYHTVGKSSPLRDSRRGCGAPRTAMYGAIVEQWDSKCVPPVRVPARFAQCIDGHVKPQRTCGFSIAEQSGVPGDIGSRNISQAAIGQTGGFGSCFQSSEPELTRWRPETGGKAIWRDSSPSPAVQEFDGLGPTVVGRERKLLTYSFCLSRSSSRKIGDPSLAVSKCRTQARYPVQYRRLVMKSGDAPKRCSSLGIPVAHGISAWSRRQRCQAGQLATFLQYMQLISLFRRDICH
nr:hypothetical protein CFP56_21175 [Quercus suber]